MVITTKKKFFLIFRILFIEAKKKAKHTSKFVVQFDSKQVYYLIEIIPFKKKKQKFLKCNIIKSIIISIKKNKNDKNDKSDSHFFSINYTKTNNK